MTTFATPTPSPAPTPPTHPVLRAGGGGPSPLEANLAALAIRSPQVAARLRQTAPRTDLEWITTDQAAAPSALMDGRALCSRRRPLEEAQSFASGVDLTKAGAVVVLGFGLGYHLSALAQHATRHTAVIAFEPDLALLRAVFERIDCSQWMRDTNVVVFTHAEDSADITRGLAGLEALLALGITVLEHAPSRPRLEGAGGRFAETLTRVVASVRTQIITTMVQMGVTVRNLLMNCDYYARGSGVAELKDIAAGCPAIVVSAGPSLRRNIQLLKTPGLRDRCVIIAVQTVLKQLLSLGIRPHFVTALDYHEISARFYEGLTAEDVQGVTLVAEPKANPAILASFPGAIRLVESEYLDLALGRDLAAPEGPRGSLKAGATVAHLAYYLARHLGCDPVILTGQDLAFTDGQYYSAGAAIHDIWASELNDFNTLEMMEWQRIIRWRGHLHALRDHLGRPVYTDDQMSAYIAQFERDFLADSEEGLTTIDATEGGVAKSHAQILPLQDAIDRFAASDARKLPDMPGPIGMLPATRMRQLKTRLKNVHQDLRRVSDLSRQSVTTLSRMIAVQHEAPKINALIEQVHELRGRVERIEPAYGLVQKLNQAGAFKRFRADRLLQLAEGLDPYEAQRRQIERDQMNVSWLADATDSLADTIKSTIEMLEGGSRLTRDPAPPAEEALTGEADNSGLVGAPRPAAAKRTIAAIVPVTLDHSALGWARKLDSTLGGSNLLQLTLMRLAHCERVDRAIVVCDDPDRARALIGEPIPGLEIIATAPASGTSIQSSRNTAAARIWARSSWRGGLGYATAWDEVFHAGAISATMAAHNLDACLLVGGDWCLIDPMICDAVIERYAENPAGAPLTFAHAAPGLAGVVLTRTLASNLAEGRARGDRFASIGGLLGFVPDRARTDPIAGQACVTPHPSVRDAAFRFIPDSPRALKSMSAALQGMDLTTADAQSIVGAVRTHNASCVPCAPERITLELCTDRSLPLLQCGATRAPMPVSRIAKLVAQLRDLAPDAALTLGGFGDPLLHPELTQALACAGGARVAGLHLRTDLVSCSVPIESLLEHTLDVISVDMYAQSADTYAALTGFDGLQIVLNNIDLLIKARRERGSTDGTIPWIVPRMARRDAVYEHVELHFDRGLLVTGACVIDAMPAPIPGERIEPFDKPCATAQRDWQSRMMILCDGSVIADERDAQGAAPVANVFQVGVAEAWRLLMERRNRAQQQHGHSHPDLWTGW